MRSSTAHSSSIAHAFVIRHQTPYEPCAHLLLTETCLSSTTLQVQNQLSTTLPGGSNIVFENFTSLQLMGSTESQLQVFDGSTHIGRALP